MATRTALRAARERGDDDGADQERVEEDAHADDQAELREDHQREYAEDGEDCGGEDPALVITPPVAVSARSMPGRAPWFPASSFALVTRKML